MKELSSLLDFIYDGEVKVAQTDLDQFLQTAADLQVKGLTEENLNLKPQTEAHERQQTDEEEVKHEYNDVYTDDSQPSVNILKSSQPSVNLLQSYEEITSRDSTQNNSKDIAIESHDTIANGHLYSTIPEKD